MWAAVGTRPDIAFPVGILSKFLDNPGLVHWEAVKHVFRYLQGTKDLRLTYGAGKKGLEGYSDADGMSQENRRAISGFAFIIDGVQFLRVPRNRNSFPSRPSRPNMLQ
jgi:hypothetical protein